MQTSTHNTEHHHADRGGKVLAMVIGLLLLFAAIWALTSLFNREGTVTGGAANNNMAVERSTTDTTGTEPSPTTP